MTEDPRRPRGRRTPEASARTRAALVEAAIETLRHDGYGGASARVIAGRAGCNQALVFYHYGSVPELLLAALDEVSARREQRYSARVAGVTTAAELFAAAAEIFREDIASGDAAVLVEMIAGAATTPGLGEQVAARIAPWRDFARQAIDARLAGSPLAAVLPTDDLSHAVVALYLGLELLAHLDNDPTAGAALFDHAAPVGALLDAFTRARTAEEHG